MSNSNDQAVPQDIPRRQLLLWLGGLGLLAILGEVVWETIRFLFPPLTHPVPEAVKAGAPADFALNTLTVVPAATAWLGYDEAGFFAMSAVCPHLGCTLGATGKSIEGTTFECPCHGSRFNDDGSVLKGPATRPMSYLAVRREEGILIIDPAKTVSPETRLAV